MQETNVSVKNAFLGLFFHKQKGARGFPVTGRYQCRCHDCSFIYKTVSQLFEILISSKDIWGNVHYVPEINIIS